MNEGMFQYYVQYSNRHPENICPGKNVLEQSTFVHSSVFIGADIYIGILYFGQVLKHLVGKLS